MEFVIGQRFISEMEPELGLGVVIDLAHKRVTFSFDSLERTYSTEHPPVKRIIFAVGDEITTITGESFEVESIREEDGVYYYSFDGNEISELFVSSTISFTSPYERLSAGISDTNKEFHLRSEILKWQTTIKNSPACGFTGGKIELLPHQFSVASSICNATERRFFLADEVGLGKTIEAILVIHRLLLTEQLSRVLIVVPSALIHQWFIELYRRFSLLATIVNDDFKERFTESDENLFETESIVIVSELELEQSPLIIKAIIDSTWDMLVVDEAHHLTKESQTYPIISHLANATDDLLLLTASPEAMEPEQFFALLQILDQNKYSTFEKYEAEEKQYKTVASLADRLLTANFTETDRTLLQELMPQREIPQLDTLSVEEMEQFVVMLIDLCGVGRVLFRNSRSVITGFPEREVTIVELPADNKLGDSKVQAQWVDSFLREHTESKTLLICKSMETMKLLQKELSKLKSRKITTFHEEMTILQLDRSAAWFADEEGAEILISTEIGCEGRNFQYADHLVLINLPEEPELLEQRIGRLDRIGRKSTVSIFVPVVEGTIQQRLAHWYNDGLNAFSKTVAGAHRIGSDFVESVIEFSGSPKEWKSIIEKTTIERDEIAERVESGRNRLLELSSCNISKAKELTDYISKEENRGLPTLMSTVFEHFGIFMDDLAPELYHLDFSTLTDDTFPIPMNREEDGMSVTFNRELALAREDVDFLSIDHPIVLGAFDLLTGGEKGNCSVARFPNSGETGFLLELFSVHSTPSGSQLFPERYFPTVVDRIIVDDFGDDVDDVFDEETLSNALQESSVELLQKNYPDFSNVVTPFIKEFTESMKAKNCELIENAQGEINSYYGNEINRIQSLTQDETTIEKLKEEQKAQMEIVNKAHFRIESIRVILLEK